MGIPPLPPYMGDPYCTPIYLAETRHAQKVKTKSKHLVLQQTSEAVEQEGQVL